MYAMLSLLLLALAPQPRILFSTYVGSSRYDEGGAVAFDRQGNVVVCGATSSSNFAWVPKATPRWGDAFVAKLTPNGSRIVWAKLFGGSLPDGANAVAVDAAGNIYVAGHTYSSDLPVTAGAAQKQSGGYIAKYSPDGDLLYASYFGDFDTWIGGIAVDRVGNLTIAGASHCAEWVQHSKRAIFVTRLAADGRVVYSTCLPGEPFAGVALAVDDDGNAYVTGSGRGFKAVNALQPQCGGRIDAVVVKLAPDGKVLFSTFFGGIDADWGNAIAVTADGIWIAGRMKGKGSVVKLDRDGRRILASMSIPGLPRGLTALRDGRVAVCGVTSSRDFPLRLATQPFTGNEGNGFVMVLAPDASIDFSTCFGDGAACSSIASDGGNVVAFTGRVLGGGGHDAFVAAIDLRTLH